MDSARSVSDQDVCDPKPPRANFLLLYQIDIAANESMAPMAACVYGAPSNAFQHPARRRMISGEWQFLVAAHIDGVNAPGREKRAF